MINHIKFYNHDQEKYIKFYNHDQEQYVKFYNHDQEQYIKFYNHDQEQYVKFYNGESRTMYLGIKFHNIWIFTWVKILHIISWIINRCIYLNAK